VIALRQLAEVVQVTMYTVYALYNKKHDKIYIGQTADLEERLELHNNKTFKHSYTSRFDGAWVLIYKEQTETRDQALIREKQLKSFRGREFVKHHIP
jgi:putative endonuclease